MALKRVAKLNGYHSLTVGRKYKSRYWLESRHWDLSGDAINFSYWQMKLFFWLYFTKNINFFSSHHFMAYYKSPCLGLKNRDIKPIGRYETAKTAIFNKKNEVFNQFVECRNSELHSIINYRLKWRFRTLFKRTFIDPETAITFLVPL